MTPDRITPDDELRAMLRSVHTQLAQREGTTHDAENCPVCTDERSTS